MTDEKTSARPVGYTERLLGELRARGLPIPDVLQGEPRPAWAELHGYAQEALKILNRTIAAHVRSGAYQAALAADLSERFDLDGQAVSAVSELDRHSAALSLFARALKAGSAPPRAVLLPPQARQILGLRTGPLKPGEIERRRAVLAGIKK